MLQKVSLLPTERFNKGLVTHSNFFKLEPGQSPACLNVKFNIDDSIEKRLGNSTMNTVALETVGGGGMFDFGVSEISPSLLLHFKGGDSSFTFIDSSIYNNTVVTASGAQISTTQSKFGGSSGLFWTPIELDWMEYSTDALAQAAYVSSSTATDFCNGGTASAKSVLGAFVAANGFDNDEGTKWISDYADLAVLPQWIKYDLGVGVTKTATKLRLKPYWDAGGGCVKIFRLEGSNNDSDWDLIYSHLHADDGEWEDYTFSNTTAYRYYRIDILTNWRGDEAGAISEIELMQSLQCYSESTIKQQGSYSLKAVALATDSLNDTLTRTVSPTINLTNIDTLKFDVRASRTGSNFKIGIHDAGGTTTEHTPNIITVDTWQTETIDISAVTSANKDAIDSIIITITDADADNTIYIDNFYSSDRVYNFGAYLAIPDSDYWHLPNDWSILFQIRFLSLTSAMTFVSQYEAGSSYWYIAKTDNANGNKLSMKWMANGTALGEYVMTNTWAGVNTATWYHLMFARSGSVGLIYIEGTSQALTATTTFGAVVDISQSLLIGRFGSGGMETYLSAYIDEFALYKGILTEASNFTPPTEEYAGISEFINRLLCASGTGIYYSDNIGKTFVVCQTSRSAVLNNFSFVKKYAVNTNDDYEAPQYWAGSAGTYFSNIATDSAPLCKYSAAFQGFMFLLNEKSNRRSVYYEDENDIFTSSSWSSFELPTEKNDELTVGIILRRKYYVSSKYRLFRLGYIGGNPDWTYKQIKDWGFVSKTVKQIQMPGVGEVIIGLDWSKRLRIFDGVDDEIISVDIEHNNGITPFYMDNINSEFLIRCWAENDIKEQVYKLYVCYGDSSTVTHCVNFNYRNGALYVDDNQTFQAGILAQNGLQNLHMLACDYDGYVHHIDSGNLDVDTAVNDYYTSPFFFRKSPAISHKAQKMYLYFNVDSCGTLYYEDRNDFSNVWNLRNQFDLVSALSAIQTSQTVDLPTIANVYQFKLSSSANTANPWKLNRTEYAQTELGVGVP